MDDAWEPGRSTKRPRHAQRSSRGAVDESGAAASASESKLPAPAQDGGLPPDSPPQQAHSRQRSSLGTVHRRAPPPKVEHDGPRSSRIVPLRDLLEFLPDHRAGDEATETRGTRLPLEKQLQALVGFEARQGIGRKTDWSLRPKRKDVRLPGVQYPIRSWPQLAAHLDEWLKEGEG